MSIFLSESHRMLKADFQRPGRYFGWTYPDFHHELLYLTYFKKNFITANPDTDNPVVRDPSIPLITHNGTFRGISEVGTIGSAGTSVTALPSSFLGIDYMGICFHGYVGSGQYWDTADMPWNLPFGSTDRWSITFRGFYPTGRYIKVQYSDDEDIDTYYLNPSVSVLGNYSQTDGYTHFGSGDYRNGAYPHKVLSTYKQATEASPKYWPDDFPGTTLYNGTVYGSYHDPDWPDGGGHWPPAGRMFYSFGNDQVPQENGDQWYYTVIVGHGDGSVSIYINGERIMNVPFERITHVEFYDGAKKFNARLYDEPDGLVKMQVTELSLWSGDLSYNDRMNVPLKTQPIYKKENGIYVPNEMY